jgi:pimeloyl-ACP methyl ester carboxylesterase
MHAMADVAMDEIPFEMIKPFYQTMSATARLAWDPYLHDPKLRKRLHRVTAPTLVVHGTKDTLIPRAHAEAYAAEIPGARLVDVPDVAHLLAIEKPAELADLIRHHLA